MLESMTPTQRCMAEILADGLPHPRRELLDCISDAIGLSEEMKRLVNLRKHISDIRKKLPVGEEIVCVLYKRSICYRHVRVLVGSSQG